MNCLFRGILHQRTSIQQCSSLLSSLQAFQKVLDCFDFAKSFKKDDQMKIKIISIWYFFGTPEKQSETFEELGRCKIDIILLECRNKSGHLKVFRFVDYCDIDTLIAQKQFFQGISLFSCC